MANGMARNRPSAYKHRFNRWKIKKTTNAEEKKEAISKLGTSDVHASASGLSVVPAGSGREVPRKLLKRYLADQIRHRVECPLTTGVSVIAQYSVR